MKGQLLSVSDFLRPRFPKVGRMRRRFPLDMVKLRFVFLHDFSQFEEASVVGFERDAPR